MQNTPFASPGFIVGVGRSGTTLLASILNRHPDVAVTPETHFFRHVAGFPGGEAAIAENWPNSGLLLLQKVRSTRSWQPDASNIVKTLGPTYPGIKRIFEFLGTSIAESQGKKLWIEKTPSHLMDLKIIRAIFPEAPIIYVVRDGRDVALSMMRVHWGSASFFANLFTWMQENRLGRRLISSDKNTYVIRYEDILYNPDKEIDALCKFLGVTFLSEMLEPDGNEDSLIEQGYNHKEKIKEPPDRANAYAWRHILSSSTSRAASAIAADELEIWHYESGASPRTYAGNIRLVESDNWGQWSASLDDLLNVIVENSGCRINTIDFASAGKTSAPNTITIIGEIVPEHIEHHGIFRIFNMAIILSRLRFRILTFRRHRIAYLWIYHGDAAKTERWRYRKMLEKMSAKHARMVICPCNREHCPITRSLHVDARVVAHTGQSDFKAKVIGAIKDANTYNR